MHVTRNAIKLQNDTIDLYVKIGPRDGPRRPSRIATIDLREILGKEWKKHKHQITHAYVIGGNSMETIEETVTADETK